MSDNEIEVISHKALSQPFQKVSESELMFLILKYLQSDDSLSDVTTLLEQRLITSKKFGKVICWDGSSKSLNLQDFQRKFPLITQNHLPLLLLKTIPTSQSLPSGSSLLRSITGFYNPSSQEQFDLFKSKSSQFSMVCGRLRENRRKLDFLQSKLTILTSPQRQKNLQPAAFQQILLSDGDIDLTAVLEYENSNPDWRSNHLVLHQADISRQIQKMTVEIPQVEYAIKDDEINKSTTIEELRDAGCLLSGRFRGNLDSGLDYLTQRLYSNGQWHSNNNRYLASSHQYFQRRLLTNYKRLYTVSGHSYNPVYCSVFDLTGNFLITGADDYLVKVWDVNKGQLIRTCRGHKNYITLIAVSSDNSMFASACTGGVIRVWRMQDGLCLLVVHHNAPVNWLKFDPSTGCLASASDDGFTIVWDLLRLIDEERCYSPLLKTLRHQNQRASIVPHSSSFDGLGETVEPINQNSSSSASVPSSSFASFPVHSNNVVDNGLDDFQKCIIGLPHLQDSSISSVQGEPRKVLSLDVSPLGNIIVTGCDDGVVRVWRYGFSATGAITTSKYNTRGPNKEMRLDLIRMKNHLSRDDYVKYERIVNHLLLRLEGHVSPVTDIQINSLGDRVLTASTMDGSVRIWSLNSDYSDSVHIILDLADEDEDQINRAAPIRIRGRGAHSRQRSQIHVFNVTWTCDDLQVITIQSVPNLNSSSVNSTNATRLKVWDSVTGDLLRVIKNISDTASRCICRHPKDPKIIVTAGEDGIVNVWNTDEELNLHYFKLSIESIENPGTFMAANVVDLSFTPDGTRLVATDFFGRLTVFGLDDPKRFDAVLSDQYFSSDYAEIMHDDEGNALDVGTQLPVHLSPVGILTRIDGAPHDVTPKITTYPEAFSVNSVLEQLRSIEEENKMVWRERDRVFRLFLRNKESGRSSGPGGASSFRNRRKNRESPKGTGPGNLLSTKTGNIKPFQPLRPRKINYIEFDVDQYQPSSDEEAADSDWDGKSDQAEEVDEDSLDSPEGSIDDDDSRIRVSRRKKGRKLNERSSDLRRSSRHRTHVESYDDAIGNGENDSGSEVFFAPSSRTNRANARRGRKKSAPQGMDDIDNANEIISSNEFSTPFWDEDYVEEEADKEDEGNFEHSQNKKKRGRPAKNGGGKPAKEKNGNKTKRTKRVAADEKVSEFDFGISIDRSWLQGDSQLECIYIPQIGDRVIYFPQGHREHLQFFTEDVSPPWNSFPQKWPLVECIIRHIEYRFPGDQELRWTASTVAEITLAITGTPSRNVFTASGQYHVTFVPPRSTRNNTREQLIKVTMRNSQLPDFLVLSDVFMKTIRVAWHQGVLISVQYKEHNEAGEIIFKEYKGKVVSLSNCDPDWPQSPWEALEVSWEDTSDVVDRISPWEAKAVHSSVVSTQTFSNSQINEADSQKAADEINGLIEKHADYEAFHYEVDSRVYPDYYSFIALPIYVDLIVRRLQNQYYRQVESLQFDINQMFENCKQYNSDLSEIVKVASNLRDEMLKIVLLAINHDSFADDNPMEGSATANAHTSSDIGRGRRSRELGDSLIITGAPVSQVQAETGYNEDDEPLVISFKRKRGESLSSKAPEESVDYFEDNLSDPSSNDYFPKKKASRLQRSSSPVQEIMKRGKSSRLKDLDDENEEDPKSLRISLKSRKTELKTKGSNYRRKNGRRKEENESEDESETSDKQSESDYSTDENESEEDNYDFDSNSSVSEKPSRGKNSGKKAQRKGKRITSSSRKTNESTSYSTRGRKASKFNQHDSDVEEEASSEEDDGSDSPPVRRSNRGRGREPVSTTTRVTRRTKKDEDDDEEESNEEDGDFDSPPVRRSNRGRGKEPVSTSARVTRRTKKDEEDDEEESNEEDDGSDSPPVRRSNRGRGREPATTSVRVTRRTKNALTHEEEEDDEEESGNVRRSSRSRKTIKSYNEDDSEAEESTEVHPERNGRQRRKVSVKAEEYGEKQDKRRTSNRSSHRQIELEETNNRNYNSSHSGRRMDPEIKKTFQAIVSYAEKLDEEYRFFAEPVDVDVAIGYYEIISIPMDLSTVRSKLSSREYVEYREMIDDILLIYDNCILYNRDDSIYTKEAKRQRKKFIGFVSTELKIEW